MKLNTDSLKLGFFDTVCETAAEQSFDAEINLPDYCPEIQKILKCSLVNDIITVQNNSGRINAEISAKLSIIYIGGNGAISAYEQSYPIQKFIDSSKITFDCLVNLKVNTDYLNCRAVSPRKIEAKGMLTFIIKAEKKTEDNILCYAEGAGVKVKTEEINPLSLIGLTEKTFNIGEVVEVSSDKKSVGRVVNVSSFSEINEIKKINNKVLLKGACNVIIHYIPEESNMIESISHTMPISQIIELDGLDENSLLTYKLSVSSCDAVPKIDSSGNIRLIDLNVRINVFLAAFEEKALSIITDSYSVEYESENSFRTLEFSEKNDSFDTSFTNKIVLESIGVSVDCVLAVWCNDMKYNFTAKDDKCIVSGSYVATVIYRDSEGISGSVSKAVDFDYSAKVRNKSERMKVIGSAQISGCSCVVTGDSRLELKTEIIAEATVFTNSVRKYVGYIDIKPETRKMCDECALTVYYSDRGESIWNIARRYNTTVDAILIENNLQNEFVEDDMMLLIPASN